MVPPSPSNIYRCPVETACVNSPDSRCAEGTGGLLCAVCEDGYGRVGNECRLCSDTARTHSLTFSVLVLVSAVCTVSCYFRRRRTRGDDMSGQLTTDNPLTASLSVEPTKAETQDIGLSLWFRAMYQPVRIIVGYCQVVTQIGPVLHFDFPPGISRVFGFLHPMAVDVQSLLQLDCVLHTSFYKMWILRVFLIPSALVAIVGLRYAYERKYSIDPAAAQGSFRANIFVVPTPFNYYSIQHLLLPVLTFTYRRWSR